MESRAIGSVTDAASNFAHEVSKAKVLIDDVLEDGKRKVGRIVKHGVRTADECVEDSTYFIKRHPWQSVGTALGLGACIGLLAGWLTTRACQRNGRS